MPETTEVRLRGLGELLSLVRASGPLTRAEVMQLTGLARSTVTSAAALLDLEGGEPAELRRQVTSPGGTTEAALKVLLGQGGLSQLLDQAVAAAVARARELG